MRIAMIYLGRRGSGGPTSLTLATHLADHLAVAVVSSYAEQLAVWQQSGLPLIQTPTYHGLVGALGSWLNQPRLQKLALEIRSHRPDVVLYPMIDTWSCFLQWYLRPIPGVVVVHDPTPHPGLFHGLVSLFERALIRQATRCITLSQSLVPDLVRQGVPQHMIDVIPMGMLSYYQAQARPESQAVLRSEAPVLLFFGRITAYKGLEVLLQAFAQLSQHHAVRLRIVGAGSLRPYQSRLDGLQNVEIVNRWIGEEEVMGFFTPNSIVVLPYTSASQSGVIRIAASAGVPVIATNTGGLAEQIIDGATGLLVEPGSPEQLATAIEHLLKNPSFARQLGDNLKRDYIESRNWDIIAERVYHVCQQAWSEEEQKHHATLAKPPYAG
ncbi:MAG: glycosyltransferase family 4 protein [Chloroflexaceae bacterium]|nr:glycosyltransferase family 4 protein [Chloroflexaceae bacterium]